MRLMIGRGYFKIWVFSLRSLVGFFWSSVDEFFGRFMIRVEGIC